MSNLSTQTSSSTTPQTTQYQPPSRYDWPPFFTLQPITATRNAQLLIWRDHILGYCRHHRLFRISLPSALDTPLFTNPSLRRALKASDAAEVLSWLAGKEGGGVVELITPGRSKTSGGEAGGGTSSYWVYWRSVEEWGRLVEGWVDETGQRGTVMTVYEILEGEGSVGQEFHGMDQELLVKGLQTLVKKGKASIFGDPDNPGIKIF